MQGPPGANLAITGLGVLKADGFIQLTGSWSGLGFLSSQCTFHSAIQGFTVPPTNFELYSAFGGLKQWVLIGTALNGTAFVRITNSCLQKF